MKRAVLLFLAAWSAAAMVFTNDPSNHVVALGSGFDGVVFLATPSGGCSGALLSTGIDVLTAAHCFDDLAIPSIEIKDFQFKFIYQNANNMRAVKQIDAQAVSFAPGWLANPDPAAGNDLAVVRLAEAAPAEVNRYSIYRNNNEIGRVGKLFGYGQIGTGDTGEMPQNDIVDYFGQNVFESHGDFLNLSAYVPETLSANLLIYDFSNCNPDHDAFNVYFNQPDKLCVINEANTALGDSGGPTFLNGQIAGVHSFGFDMKDLPGDINSDIDDIVNSTYGELSADTEVSTRAQWIDSVTPEPWSFGPFAAALGVLWWRYRRRRRT